MPNNKKHNHQGGGGAPKKAGARRFLPYFADQAIVAQNGKPSLQHAHTVTKPDFKYVWWLGGGHDDTDSAVIPMLGGAVTKFMLPYSQITDLTVKAIAQKCRRLKWINVTSCKKLHDSSFVELVQKCGWLKSIDIAYCYQLTDKTMHAIAQHCRQLEYINITNGAQVSDGGFVELAEKCSGLKSIEIAYCDQLTDAAIHAIAQHCRQLEDINVCGCHQLRDGSFVELAEKCGRLKSIDLTLCSQITFATIHAIAQHCRQLEDIDVGGCEQLRDSSFVELVEKCSRLKSISFHGCSLTKVPEHIDRLGNLKSLNVWNNRIKVLPRSIVNLPPSCYLDFDDNPLQQPPLEIADRGQKAIERYFKELGKGPTTISRQLKVVLVGNGGAGKTSLRRALEQFDQPLTKGKDESTIYVDVCPFSLPPESCDEEPLTINVYDCGGQETYAVAQTPFLTGSSLFILVVPADEASDEWYDTNIFRFLVLLQSRAPGAVVQLVLSKTDLLTDQRCRQEKITWLRGKVEDAQELLKSEATAALARTIDESVPKPLYVLTEILAVSVKNEPDVARYDIQRIIFNKENLEKFPSVGQSIPGSWRTIWDLVEAVRRCGDDADEDELLDVARRTNAERMKHEDLAGNDAPNANHKPLRSYCRVDELRAICEKLYPALIQYNGTCTLDLSIFDDALRLLNDQGDVFIDGPLVVLQPKFVTDLLSPILDHTLTEKVQSADFKLAVELFMRESQLDQPTLVLQKLEKLVKSGELDSVVLPYLWRDISLRRNDYESVVQMFDASGAFFKQTLLLSGEVIRVVLSRLFKDPPSQVKTHWPIDLPAGMTQLVLLVQVIPFCPSVLSARLTAFAQSFGHCPVAWQGGAVIVGENYKKILVEESNDTLIWTVRGRELDIQGLQRVVDFVKDERKERLPGLMLNITLECPCGVCTSSLGANKSHFPWQSAQQFMNRGEYCMNLNGCISFRDGMYSQQEFPVPSGRLLWDNVSKIAYSSQGDSFAALGEKLLRVAEYIAKYNKSRLDHAEIQRLEGMERSAVQHALDAGLDIATRMLKSVPNDSDRGVYDIFVSHAGEENSYYVDEIVEMMKEEDPDRTIFIDSDELKPGDTANPPVAMLRSVLTARRIVYVASYHFVQKKWPIAELLCGLARNNAMPEAMALTESPIFVDAMPGMAWLGSDRGKKLKPEIWVDDFLRLFPTKVPSLNPMKQSSLKEHRKELRVKLGKAIKN